VYEHVHEKPVNISFSFSRTIMQHIDTETTLYGLIGHPVAHSLGPLMHNHAFAETGINGVYLAFDVTDVKSALAGMRALNICGISVTIPHKTEVMQYLDEIDDTARRIGAVNTIVCRDGRLIGYNTDAHGAVCALKEKTEIRARNVVIIGAGGAARAVGFGISEQGGRVHIVNRTAQKGRQLAEELNAAFHSVADLHAIKMDILINTTSVGMHPKIDEMPIPAHLLKPGMCVMDIVYNPIKTRLLHEAEAAGGTIVDGVAMFVHQGAMQFSLWTGKPAPIDSMRQLVYGRLKI